MIPQSPPLIPRDRAGATLLLLPLRSDIGSVRHLGSLWIPEFRGLPTHIEPLRSYSYRLIPAVLTTRPISRHRGAPALSGGLRFRSASLPRDEGGGTGGSWGSPAPLPAWSPPIGISPVGFNNAPLLLPAPRLQLGPGFRGAGGILHDHPRTEVGTPPGHPVPSTVPVHPYGSRTHVPGCPCFGVIRVLLRPQVWKQRPAGEGIPRGIHTAWRGPY